MVSSTVSRPLRQDEEGVSSNGGLGESRVASAAGEGTAETGIEVDSAVGEVVASTGIPQHAPLHALAPVLQSKLQDFILHCCSISRPALVLVVTKRCILDCREGHLNKFCRSHMSATSSIASPRT